MLLLDCYVIPLGCYMGPILCQAVASVLLCGFYAISGGC